MLIYRGVVQIDAHEKLMLRFKFFQNSCWVNIGHLHFCIQVENLFSALAIFFIQYDPSLFEFVHYDYPPIFTRR